MQPLDLDGVISSIETAKADWAAVILSFQAAVIERDRLQTLLDACRDTVGQQTGVIDDLEHQITQQNVELAKARQDLIDCLGEPPPVPVPAAEMFRVTGPPGGGGPNSFCQMANGDLRYAYDVGGGIHIPKDHAELAHPCDWGELDRHVVTLTPYLDTVLRWMGNPGHSYGAQLLDVVNDKWGTKLVGSEKGQGNAQNGYGEKGGNWAYGIGDGPYNRSTGQLVYREPGTGETIFGEFGYAPPGSGVTVVTSAGVERRIPGTDQWACRNLIRETADTCLVSVWRHTVDWGKVMSPGGLYRVNWKTGTWKALISGVSVEACVSSGSIITAVTWEEGIKQSGDGGQTWSDMTFNAPRSTKWRSVDSDPLEGIVISGSNPTGGFCWGVLRRGSSTWINLSASVDSRDLTTLAPWHPPISGNDMGKSGCTLTQTKWVTWKGKRVPACIGVGVLWMYLDGKCRPLAFGGGITSNRDVVSSPDGQHTIITMMDHRVQAAHDFGTSWAKETQGLGGPIDFGPAGFDKVTKRFLVEGGDGSRWVSNGVDATTKFLTWVSTTQDPRPHNLPSPDLVVSSTDIKWKGESIDDHVRERMGDVAKVHYTGGFVYAIGHGAMRRKVT